MEDIQAYSYNTQVFGQVYEGIEVVDKIAAVETNESNDKPKTDVVIEKIEVKEAE